MSDDEEIDFGDYDDLTVAGRRKKMPPMPTYSDGGFQDHLQEVINCKGCGEFVAEDIAKADRCPGCYEELVKQRILEQEREKQRKIDEARALADEMAGDG